MHSNSSSGSQALIPLSRRDGIKVQRGDMEMAMQKKDLAMNDQAHNPHHILQKKYLSFWPPRVKLVSNP